MTEKARGPGSPGPGVEGMYETCSLDNRGSRYDGILVFNPKTQEAEAGGYLPVPG